MSRAEINDIKVVRLTDKEREFLSRSDFEVSVPITKNTSMERTEVFAFRDFDDCRDILFDIRAIKNAILAGKVPFAAVEHEITPELIDIVEKHGGVDYDYLDSNDHVHDIDMPIIVVIWNDGTSTIIDGNHRILRRSQRGLKNIRSVVLPKEDAWIKFTYVDEEIPITARHLFDSLPKERVKT